MQAAEDALLDQLIAEATVLAEAFTAQGLLIRDRSEILDARPDWQRLSLTPVRSVASVEGLTVDGGAVSLPLAAISTDIDARGDGWVRVAAGAGAPRVRVRMSVGLAPRWSELPEPVRLGIIRLAAHYFTHRDAAEDAGPPAAVAALLRPWRRMRLS